MKIGLICCPLLAALLLIGCGERKAPSAKAPSAPANTASPGAAPPVISASDAAAFGIKTPEGEADLAWREVEKTLETLIAGPADEPENPTKEQIAEFQRKQGEKLAAAAEKAREFHTKYPTHASAAEAKEHEKGLLTVAARLGDTNAAQRLGKLEQSRLDDPSLPEDERLQLRLERVQREAAAQAKGDMKVMLREMEAGVRQLQKEFPKRSEFNGLLIQIAEAHLNGGDADKARTLANEVTEAKPEGELKEAAQQLIAKLGRVGKPLNIKFQAVDGREVDLGNLKGKVVLVDFWATWCGPCMAELPNLKATYEKLHEKGFEIVGISFDRDVNKLKQVVAREKMTWPQYFDSESEGNKYGEEFGITGIPTMWLVDKKGVLRELNARDQLETKVEKLLAEN
jgi:thiol-disulfide isomerase/thioredoxin